VYPSFTCKDLHAAEGDIMANLQNQVVLITGCSSGIGRGLAYELAKTGHHVVATARRPDSLSGLVHENISHLQLDVTDPTSIDKAVNAVVLQHGRIDMLINNAGFGLIGPVSEIPLSDLRKQFETNVFGAVALVQAVVPIMAKHKWGRIVNVGSIAGITATPFGGAYCSSKAALHALSDSLRMEVQPFGIEVVVIRPGGIKSQFGENADSALERYNRPESRYHGIFEHIKMRAKMGQTEKATSVEEFVKQATRMLIQRSAPPTWYYGQGSTLMPFLKYTLTTRHLDRILQKRFGLDKIA
jgi:NAD(P)-dependent dehydrogenase (short-subunit alcohol dehydrogenase family)